MAIKANDIKLADECKTTSAFVGGEKLSLGTRNLANLPNRQVILFVAKPDICNGKTGQLKSVKFPQDFIVPDQASKIKYDLKAELDKFDVANDKVGLDYITGYTEVLDFEASFMNVGKWSDFMEEMFIDKPIGIQANMVSLLVYGVENATFVNNKLTGTGIKAILKVGPAEADSLISTGDEKKMSVTKIVQHSSGTSKRITLDNKNGQYDKLLNAMIDIESIFDGVWDNNNANKLL